MSELIIIVYRGFDFFIRIKLSSNDCVCIKYTLTFRKQRIMDLSVCIEYLSFHTLF